MRIPKNLLVTLAIIALAIVAIFLIRWYTQLVPSDTHEANLEWYIRKARQWELQARILRVSQVVLAATAILASILSAAQWKPKRLSDGFLAVLAAVSVALLTGLDLSSQANKMRNAERRLRVAILEYRQESDSTLEDLLKAYQEAENIVGDYTPDVGAR